MSKSLLLLLTIAVACGTLHRTRQKLLVRSAINKAREFSKTGKFRNQVRLIVQKESKHMCGSCRSFASMVKEVGKEESPQNSKVTLNAMLTSLCTGQANQKNNKAVNSGCEKARKRIAQEVEDGGNFVSFSRTATCNALGFCPSQEILENLLAKQQIKRITERQLHKKDVQQQLVLIEDRDEFIFTLSAIIAAAVSAKVAIVAAATAAAAKAAVVAAAVVTAAKAAAAVVAAKLAAAGVAAKAIGTATAIGTVKVARSAAGQIPKHIQNPNNHHIFKDCFPASSTVQTETGFKRMEDLRVGDYIMTADESGKMTYSQIYMFAHADRDTISEYVNVQTEAGVMKLSPMHYIPTNGFNYKYARDLQVGETVLQYMKQTGQFLSANVTKLAKSFESGVYNPHTLNGKIVVDGVVASCYSDWVLDDIFPVWSLHYVYDVIFTPLKLLSVSLGYFGLEQKLAEVTGVSNPTAFDIVDPVSIQTFGSFGVILALPILVAGALFAVAKK